MPYRRKMPYSKKMRRGRKINASKKYFSKRKATGSYYHAKVPRNLQLSTFRPQSSVLMFETVQTYKCIPSITNSSGTVVGPENCFIQFRANAIHDINAGRAGVANRALTWEAQSTADYGSGGPQVVHANGYDQWRNRYQHYTCLSSKIEATCQTLVGSSASETGTFYINLAGATGRITSSSQAHEIMALPYTKRARLFPAVNQAPGASANVPGARLGMTYSAKKFEGVSNVMDNANLRGSFDNNYGAGGTPSENSYWTIGYVPTMEYGSSSGAHAPALITVKCQWIVKLTEPTDSNQPTE